MARPRRLYGQRRPYGSVKARKEPGRPTTGYFRWLIANRARLRRQNPYLNTVNLMRAAGMEWRAMSSREKQVETFMHISSDSKHTKITDMCAFPFDITAMD